MSLLNWLPSPYYAIKCEVSKNIGQPHFNPFVGWALKQALVMNRIFTHEYNLQSFKQNSFWDYFFLLWQYLDCNDDDAVVKFEEGELGIYV